MEKLINIVLIVDVGHHGCTTCNQEVETAPQFLQPQTASGNKPIKWQHS